MWVVKINMFPFFKFITIQIVNISDAVFCWNTFAFIFGKFDEERSYYRFTGTRFLHKCFYLKKQVTHEGSESL